MHVTEGQRECRRSASAGACGRLPLALCTQNSLDKGSTRCFSMGNFRRALQWVLSGSVGEQKGAYKGVVSVVCGLYEGFCRVHMHLL